MGVLWPKDAVRFAEIMRPDSVRVWRRREIREKLSWYYAVMRGAAPAKFIIAKRIYSDIPLPEVSVMGNNDLRRVHEKLSEEFTRVWHDIRQSNDPWKELPPIREGVAHFLHIKVELLRRQLSDCRLCERKCGVDRKAGKIGVCRVPGDAAYVDTYFHHMGEEAPLVPSGTIFYVGCNFRCVYCQNWSISQRSPEPGEAVSPDELSNPGVA